MPGLYHDDPYLERSCILGFAISDSRVFYHRITCTDLRRSDRRNEVGKLQKTPSRAFNCQRPSEDCKEVFHELDFSRRRFC